MGSSWEKREAEQTECAGAWPARLKRLRDTEKDEGVAVVATNRETLLWHCPKRHPSALGPCGPAEAVWQPARGKPTGGVVCIGCVDSSHSAAGFCPLEPNYRIFKAMREFLLTCLVTNKQHGLL